MAEPSSLAKGKGKRLAEDIDVGAIPLHVPLSPSYNEASAHDSAPQIIRRNRHRRCNIATTIWGPEVLFHDDPNQPFNLYKAILRHPNLFFQFVIRLPHDTMIDLYAIDKEFHYRFNKYSVSIIHDYANYHVPKAAYIFNWVLFPDVCISDPMLRPMDGRPYLARDIPSLRWAKMVMWRVEVAQDILMCLGMEGHRVPHGTHEMLLKFWLLMETKTTAAREAYLSPNIWSDMDIICFHLFLFKLDMRLTHPVFGSGVCEFSHLLLTQKTLSVLLDVLTGKKKVDYDEASDMLVRTYPQEDLDLDTHTWLDNEAENGVPEEEWGLMSYENWHMDGKRMEPALDMVITEGIKRGLHAQRLLLEFMLYGWVDPEVDKNVPYPRRWRGEEKINVPKEAWPTESIRKPLLEKLDKRFTVEAKPGSGLQFTIPDMSNSYDDVWVEAVESDSETDELATYQW